MNRVGFIAPSTPQRIAVRNDAGDKTGYLVSRGGQQDFQDVSGRIVARNLRFKCPSPGRVGATGGSFIPQEY